MEYVTAPWVNYEDFRLWMRKSFLLFRKLLIQAQVNLHLRLISVFTKKVFELVWNRMLLFPRESSCVGVIPPEAVRLLLLKQQQ